MAAYQHKKVSERNFCVLENIWLPGIWSSFFSSKDAMKLIRNKEEEKTLFTYTIKASFYHRFLFLENKVLIKNKQKNRG